MSLGDALRAGAEITMTVEPRPPTPPPPEPEPTCRWEAMWKRGLEPGDAFDVGGVSGALASYLKRAPRPPEGSAALVPGCGRAYDALALARHGFDRVVAVDIAPTAVRAAQSFLEDEADGYDEDLGIYYIQIKGTRFTKIEVYEVDFFEVPDKFDFIWDCTFLCALDPSIRAKWAQKQKALLNENGTLLSCIFPICEKAGGPPYALSVPLVTELLEPEGFAAVEARVCEGAERHLPGAMAGDDAPADVPNLPLEHIKGVRLTRLGHRARAAKPVKWVDPRGKEGYWISVAGDAEDGGEGTDFHAIMQGFVSVTPLRAPWLTRMIVSACFRKVAWRSSACSRTSARIAAFSSAMAWRVSPKTLVCSRSTFVSTHTSPSATFVESKRPPSPHSKATQSQP